MGMPADIAPGFSGLKMMEELRSFDLGAASANLAAAKITLDDANGKGVNIFEKQEPIKFDSLPSSGEFTLVWAASWFGGLWGGKWCG